MNNAKILIIDDEISFLRSIRRVLWQDGYENILAESNALTAKEIIKNEELDLVLLDVSMPDMNGMELLEYILRQNPRTPVILVTALDNFELAFKAIKIGAYDYVVKPPNNNRFLLTIRRALDQRITHKEIDALRSGQKEIINSKPEFSDIITTSPQMNKVFELVEIFAPTDETVLITGETGSGKDLIAKKIHDLSPRKNKPYIVVNMASISSSLFESELFGHEKGAFTGAANEKLGYFEAANHGTIFLDEIGELPKELQGKLLRTIQYNEIYRIGSSKPIKLNIRIITATNKDLIEAVNNNEFRADLYHRLNRGFIHLPPLINRDDDIIILSNHFLEIGNKKYNKEIKGFSNTVLQQLKTYNFPGNVRELENIILNTVVKTRNSDKITEVELPYHKKEFKNDSEPSQKLLTLDNAIKKHIKEIIQHTNGNIQKAAVILGLSERTLQRRLKKIREEEKNH